MSSGLEIPKVQDQSQISELCGTQNLWQVCRDIGHNALSGIVKSKVVRKALAAGLAMSVGATVGTASEMTDPEPSPVTAASFVNDYPHMDAQLHDISNYEWWVDENGDGKKQIQPGTNDELSSSRGFDYRNCTDGAAYWVMKYTGVAIPGSWGNANMWNDRAGSYVIKNGNSNSVEPGDIAQSDDGTYGHVGFITGVEKNTDGNVTKIIIAELNRSGKGEFIQESYATKNSAGKFVRPGTNRDWDHFIDVNGADKGLNNEPIANGGEAVAATLAKPAAVVYNGALNVFVRGGSGDIFHQYWNGNNWTGYSSIGNGIAGDPTLLVHNNALSVFARGNDHQIYTKSNNGSGWNGWVSLGTQTMKGNPRVVQYGDEVALFALGSNSQPYKNSWFPNTGWTGWTNMGDFMDSSPSPVQHGGNLNVVMRGGNSQVYNNTWNGNSWSGFGTLGGITSGNPDVLSYGNHLNVVVNTPSQQVYMNTWNGTGWGGWANHGGNVVGGPEGDLQGDVEAMKYNNDMEFFVRGSNKHIYTRWWSDAGQNWGGWHDLGGGNLVGDPTAIQYGTELSVFVTGEDGGTYKNTFHPTQGWGGFTRLPG